MTCECCHCCFCCCEQNYDNNPNDPKRRKVDFTLPKPEPVTQTNPIPTPTPPVGSRSTPIPKPPVVTRSSEPVFEWPDDLIPAPPTVEDWMERPPIDIIRANDTAEEEEQFSFPPKEPEEPPPPPACPRDPLIWKPLTPFIKHPALSINYQQRMNIAAKKTLLVTPDHGPTPTWMNPASIAAMEWDGVPIDISGKTPSQICQLLFKDGYVMKGLRQKYEATQPFCDPVDPKISEIDAWNVEIIRHLRALVGITTPIEGDPKLFLEAQWANDRYFTNAWDAAYPGTDGTAFGPCQPGFDGNAHCGGSFIPNFTDQGPYLPQYGLEPFNRSAQTEGIGNVNTDLPWAIKLVARMSAWICSEGTTGHAGPFFTRTKVGMSWWSSGGSLTNPGAASATTVLRVKWSG